MRYVLLRHHRTEVPMSYLIRQFLLFNIIESFFSKNEHSEIMFRFLRTKNTDRMQQYVFSAYFNNTVVYQSIPTDENSHQATHLPLPLKWHRFCYFYTETF